jgi:hypothetical protein
VSGGFARTCPSTPALVVAFSPAARVAHGGGGAAAAAAAAAALAHGGRGHAGLWLGIVCVVCAGVRQLLPADWSHARAGAREILGLLSPCAELASRCWALR